LALNTPIVPDVEISAVCARGGQRSAKVDWLGITFFLLSIAASIGANLLTPRLVAYLERRKLIKSNRTQEQDLKAFRSIEAFKNGSGVIGIQPT
jgi:hypothetical protein